MWLLSVEALQVLSLHTSSRNGMPFGNSKDKDWDERTFAQSRFRISQAIGNERRLT